MNKMVAFFILLFINSICFAQQKIVFEKNDSNLFAPFTKEYTLPKSVHCTFKDGTQERLVLEKVKGDSLIFQKYYNKTQNYDCVFSSLKKIKIHKNGEVTLYILFVGLTGSAVTMSYLSYLGFNTEIKDAGESAPRLMATLILFPVAITTIGAVITLANFPKSYKPKKWKMYAK
jgi:hypothetical protein